MHCGFKTNQVKGSREKLNGKEDKTHRHLLTFLSANDKCSCIFKRAWRCLEGQEGNHDFSSFKALRDSTDLGLYLINIHMGRKER